jgi:redox-sensitive bicupin YhaK (pirin superfamily)
MIGSVPSGDTPLGMKVIDGRRAEVGGIEVRRTLPRRQRRTVGAWCFVDHMGPSSVTADRGLNVGPHPHIGLQTVTWLLDGVVLHRDSLGSEQLIRPGQLNLMTAGHGVSHSEETTGIHTGPLHGVQLWVAQPSASRDGAAAFEHHAELPRVGLENAEATILVGAFGEARSPARHDTDHVGVDLDLRPGRTVVPVDARHEHALVVFDGAVRVGGQPLGPGRLGYLGDGRDEVPVEVTVRTRALLLGGTPFPEQLLLWWNYVARTRDEIVAAHHDWAAATDRFGEVRSPLARVEIEGPPWAAA